MSYDARVSALTAILDRAPAKRIEDVVVLMNQIDRALAPADGISCFNKLYLAVTENVLAAVAQAQAHPPFADPRFLAALDVNFANLYFAALRAFDAGAGDTPRAWSPLFEARARRTVAPIQFALAGMNAHINRDLPKALVDTFAALGGTPRAGGPAHADFERVNQLLAQTETQVKDLYLDPLARQLEPKFHDVDDVVAIWSVGAARDAAWTNGEALWHLRAIPPLAQAYLRTLDRSVGFASRGLLVSTCT
jgi:hypothetical protein